MNVSVRLKNVKKAYDSTVVVKNFSLDVEDKEFIVLVGPSGCGKSTTLRMIAGLEEITEGQLFIGDDLMNMIPPGKRGVAMVFQDYALYPHMSVYENMAFGLTLNKSLTKVEIDKRINEAATMLDLKEYLQRRPQALSGGQRQRVAMGRALVKKARVFLFDEPLSNLDAKLRSKMRAEIKKFHMLTKTTTVYVTHDQLEAMTLADRIVVMREGRIEQVGKPFDVYHRPRTVFVATFIGNPAMNIFKLQVIKSQGKLCLEGLKGSMLLPLPESRVEYVREGQIILMGIRPHDIVSLAPEESSEEEVFAVVEMVELLGKNAYVTCNVGSLEFKIEVMADTVPLVGQQVRLGFKTESMHLFDFQTGENLIEH